MSFYGFPPSVEFFSLNTLGRVLYLSTFGAGALAGSVSRVSERSSSAFKSLGWSLLAATALLHAATLWVLAIDPHRNSGDIPLPLGLSVLVSAVLVILVLLGPFVSGAVVGKALRTASKAPRRDVFIAVAIAAYLFYILPWAADVIAD